MWRFDFNSLQVTRLTIPFLVMLGMLQRIATLARRYNTHTTIGRFRNRLIWKLLHFFAMRHKPDAMAELVLVRAADRINLFTPRMQGGWFPTPAPRADFGAGHWDLIC